jgi:hypothetical protein
MLKVLGFETPDAKRWNDAAAQIYQHDANARTDLQYAGPKAQAEAYGKGMGTIQAGEKTNEAANAQILKLQDDARTGYENSVEKLQRLATAAESPAGGAFTSVITSLAPILNAIVPEGATGWIANESAKLQQQGIQGAELQKVLSQEMASMIAGNTGMHSRGGEWVMKLAQSANPQADYTPAQRNELIKDIYDQELTKVAAYKQRLGIKTNTALDDVNQQELERLSPRFEGYGNRITSA